MTAPTTPTPFASLHLAAQVFAQAHEGITITDADGTIVDVNPAFCRLTGYSRDEAIGQNPRILKSGRQTPEFYVAMWRTLLDTGEWRGEIWNRRKNGDTYPEILHISAIRDSEGRTSHYLAVFFDISEIKQQQQHLERLAHFDALTQLPNRILFADRLHQTLAHAQRSGEMFAVAYMDLDGFKPINDNYGHEIGDLLLIEIAERLKASMRGGDTVARLGGDEFALLISSLGSAEECQQILERILVAVARPCVLKGKEAAVSGSIGFTLYPLDSESADVLLRHADQAMYEAKQAGRNRHHLFDAEHDQRVRSYREELARIDAALAAQEFVLHYQPKVDMRQGRVIGAEALLRWRHPERGLLLPGQFLPIVADTALDSRLGDWVLGEALRQGEEWRATGLDLTISINISARHLQEAAFAARLAEHLAAHPGLPPDRLELEIVETAALSDIGRVGRIIDACRALGVAFALDDFGTGYSSLTYLRRLPVSQLKIDQSFVRNMLDDSEDLSIVEGVISLAQAFRRTVVAEGVETPEHGMLLVQLGCDLAQGYGLARPMPAADLPAWLRDFRPDPRLRAGDTLRVPREDIPLLGMEVAHTRWVEQLADLLGTCEHQLAPPAMSHKDCRFGRWYDEVGHARYGTLPSFVELGRLHEAVHALGTDLLALHRDGATESARQRLPELHAARDALIEALRNLLLEVSMDARRR